MRPNRGKLTVFLGAASGVGKTHAMLVNAKERLAEGLDVLGVLVETHGRQETEALLVGVPMIPPLTSEHNGKAVAEVDLDGLLRRRPGLVLIDELAHGNVEGSRHVKRYQDVLEVLDAGIDVYTTLNIQHVESLNDVVSRVTGVVVLETVPDSVVEGADQVALVDIPVEELLARLREGKVHTLAQGDDATHSFFRPGNLNALREMALRWTMEHVDKQLNSYMHAHLIQGPWPARERILVAIGPSPLSSEAVRVAKRMATSAASPWIAAYVETPSSSHLSQRAQEMVSATQALAEELGGEVVVISAPSVAQGLVSLAAERNVSQIVMGKPLRPPWVDLLRGSAVEQVIRQSRGIAVHVMPDATPGSAEWGAGLSQPPQRSSDISAPRLLALLGVVATMTVLFAAFGQVFDPTSVALLYLVPVLVSASSWGFRYAMLSACLSVLCFDFFFVPPVGGFSVSDASYVFSFAVFIGLAALTSRISDRLREQVSAVRRRQTQLSILHKLSRNVAAVADLEGILSVIGKHLRERFAEPSLILLPTPEGSLVVRMQTSPDFALDAYGSSVAAWVYEHGEIAGFGTGTLSGSDSLFVPLKIEGRAIGVLVVKQDMRLKPIPPDQMSLYKSIADLVGISVERAHLSEEAEQAKWLSESDRLYHAVFNSVSHELKIPMATIMGAVTTLMDGRASLSADLRGELLEAIHHQGSKMNRLLENLLNMARIESGAMRLSLDWVDVADLVHSTVSRAREFLGARSVTTSLPDGTVLIRADAPLLETALTNVLENAAKYSPPGTPISICACISGTEVIISVGDRGPGVSSSELTVLFDKFYRGVQGDGSKSGTGLGLSICRGIVESHGGWAKAENREGGGLLVAISVPASTTAELEPMQEEPFGEGC